MRSLLNIKIGIQSELIVTGKGILKNHISISFKFWLTAHYFKGLFSLKPEKFYSSGTCF